eukprot:4640472-Heterocapsa_arctica.AAC.1
MPVTLSMFTTAGSLQPSAPCGRSNASSNFTPASRSRRDAFPTWSTIKRLSRRCPCNRARTTSLTVALICCQLDQGVHGSAIQ